MNWPQLKTILWLRWRLTRNQWTRSKGVSAFFAILIVVFAAVLGTACFVGALFAGLVPLAKATPTVIWSVWLGVTVAFLIFWLIGLLQELQRSESIDLQRLMHLPVRLGQMFVINYVASHFSVSIIIVMPAIIGLTIGLAISRGPMMLLLAPLALGMVTMISAWTYCLRGWLSGLMSNPRRRRSIVMGIVFCCVLLGQAPNLYFNVYRRFGDSAPAPGQSRRDKQGVEFNARLNRLRAIQEFVPPLWVPLGAGRLAEGNPLPALLGACGCFAIGAMGLRRAYRGTLRVYRGEPGGKAAASAPPVRLPDRTAATTVSNARTGYMELRIPGVPEQAAALALTTFRSLLRAPEVKMAWVASLLMPLVVASTLLFRSKLNLPEAAKPFLATGAIVFPVFMLVQFFSNQFGFDRDGFRALVLSPVDRKLILIGKNLACLPVGLCFGLPLLLLAAFRLHLPPVTFAAALFQFATLLLLVGLAGNLLSILVPYRIRQGSMKPTKMPGLAMLTLIVCQLLFPVVIAPVFLPPLFEMLWRLAGWSDAVPVNLISSIGLMALAVLAYRQALPPLGRLLSRRETKILSVVTVEVE